MITYLQVTVHKLFIAVRKECVFWLQCKKQRTTSKERLKVSIECNRSMRKDVFEQQTFTTCPSYEWLIALFTCQLIIHKKKGSLRFHSYPFISDMHPFRNGHSLKFMQSVSL